MKKVLILLAVIITAFTAKAEDDEKTVKTKIDDVTVFIRGAQIYESGTATVPKGVTVFIFDDLANTVNAQSMQASGLGDFTVLDVQYRYYYPEPEVIDNGLPPKIIREIRKLQDSIVYIRYELDEVRAQLEAINKEKSLLLNHRLMQGQGKVDSLELLQGSINYFHSQLVDIAKRYHIVKKREYEVLKEQTRMNVRLLDLQNYNRNKPHQKPHAGKHQALITVVSEKNTTGKLELSYLVRNAGWSPMYDIKTKDVSSPMELTYKAAIYQSTGKDWNGVKLTVSNSNPNRHNTKPYLPVWYIDYYVAQQETQANKTQLQYDDVKAKAPVIQAEDKEEDLAILDVNEVSYSSPPPDGILNSSQTTISGSYNVSTITRDYNQALTIAADFTSKMQNFTSVEFEIDLPYTIKGDGKQHYVALDKQTLTTTYKHFLVPKVDPHAYLVARITEWENLNLLMGPANIYFGNTYVGRTTLNPTILSDTLELTLGRDESIFVKRTKLKDDTKDKFMGGKKTYTGSFEIELRNNNTADVELIIEDQMPVTKNEDIEIELTKKDGGELNKTTGIITWKMDLKGRDKTKLNFTYTIRYDKDKTITGL